MNAKEKRRYAILEVALETGLLIRFGTAATPGTELGYVFSLTDKFVLIQNVSDDIFLDGYSVIRLSDIRKPKLESNDFVPRALAQFLEFPQAPNGINLEDLPALLASVDAHFPLITLEQAQVKPETIFIGRVAELKKRSVYLREITPEATWRETPREYKIADITRVGFGGRYESALWQVSHSALAGTDAR